MAGSRPWLKWAGIGCGGVLLLLVVFGAGMYVMVRSATAGPEDVARKFLSAAETGDFAGAHAAFSVPLKEQQPLDVFTAAVRANPSLFAVAEMSLTDRSIDLAGAKLAGTVTLKSGTTVPVSFTFAKEHDTWKLLAYRLGSRD